MVARVLMLAGVGRQGIVGSDEAATHVETACWDADLDPHTSFHDLTFQCGTSSLIPRYDAFSANCELVSIGQGFAGIDADSRQLSA